MRSLGYFSQTSLYEKTSRPSYLYSARQGTKGNRRGVASNTAHFKVFMFPFLLDLLLGVLLLSPSPASASEPLLKEIVIAHNQRLHAESIVDGSYSGEEGILRIGPEAAKALGMNTLIDRDYLEARESHQKADRSLDKAKAAMVSQKKERSPQEQAQQIVDHFLSSKRSQETAREKLALYRSKLNAGVDERLNDALASQVMDRLLMDSLRRMDYRLRDALAHFYNLCHGVNQPDYALTTENVCFVNEIFRQFALRASKETLHLFDLDKDSGRDDRKAQRDWKKVMERHDFQYASLLEAEMERYTHKPYAVDPLLFIALMKRESGFDPKALSRVGAAGLTQIMPQTALELGMKNIFKPAFFDSALSFMERERKTRSEAMAALFKITEENGLQNAVRARELMQESLGYGQEKEKLLAQYRAELARNRGDDRFKPAQAIEFGFRYFSRLMKEQEGDISLALASYNAGPHRVREYSGIPPFGETVLFRNKVLEYYRDYLKKAREIATNPGGRF